MSRPGVRQPAAVPTRPRPRRAPEPAQVGVGYAPAHHGELLQGIFPDASGQLRRALVTLLAPQRRSRAVFHPSQDHWGVVGTPELIKVRRAAILTLRELSRHPSPAKGGQIEITSDVPRGIGMGSSTSDVTATIRAVADYHGVRLPHDVVGRLAVAAECASDSIMIDDQVTLFAHRDGLVLESLGHRLPPIVVVGCDTSPGNVVDTLEFPPADYHDDEIAAFQVLRGGIRRAVTTGDVALLGRVATASAQLNQRFLPKPSLPSLLELCDRVGGAGVQVAHSGTVAGVILDARRPDLATAVEQCRHGIDALGLTATTLIGPDPATGWWPPAALVAAGAGAAAGAGPATSAGVVTSAVGWAGHPTGAAA